MSTKNHQKEHQHTFRERLVFGVNTDGDLVYANNEFQEIFGYSLNDLLSKNLKQEFLPTEYHIHWDTILSSLESGEDIEGFLLPFITNDGEEIVVSCSELLENHEKKGKANQYFFIGKIIKEHSKHQTIASDRKSKDVSTTNKKENIKPTNETFSLRFFNKRLVLKKQPSTAKITKEPQLKKEEPPKKQKMQKQQTELHKQISEEQFSILQMQLQEIKTTLEFLANSDIQKSTTQRQMEEILQNLQQQITSLCENKKIIKAGTQDTQIKFLPIKKGTNNKFDIFNKNKIKEIEQQALDDRYRTLQLYENKLQSEKQQLQQTRQAYQSWSEKLRILELEIEKRRDELIAEEQHYRNRLQEMVLIKEEQMTKKKVDIEDYHQILDTTPQSAVVLQRGILKQVNEPFTTLTGYSSDELQEKRLWDIIAPSGLSTVEQYHLNRLKGIREPSFETVIRTKDGNELPVDITMKSTEFNNDRAELAVINKGIAKIETPPDPITIASETDEENLQTENIIDTTESRAEIDNENIMGKPDDPEIDQVDQVEEPLHKPEEPVEEDNQMLQNQDTKIPIEASSEPLKEKPSDELNTEEKKEAEDTEDTDQKEEKKESQIDDQVTSDEQDEPPTEEKEKEGD